MIQHGECGGEASALPRGDMHKLHICIVDGYNVIHKTPELRNLLDDSLLSAREGLVRQCAEWCRRRGDIAKFYVVFDGDSSVAAGGANPAPGVNVIYSRSRETADERIVELLKEERPDCEYTVVSDDGYVVRQARDARASVMSVQDFCAVLFHIRRSDLPGKGIPRDKNSLTPAQEKDITDSLRREWGV